MSEDDPCQLARERALRISAPDMVCGDDGFYVFWPIPSRGGYASHELRWLADDLDSRNESWRQEMERELPAKPLTSNKEGTQ